MKKIIYVIALLLTVGFSSCLKDDAIVGPEAPGYIPNVIELYNIAPVTSPETGSTYPRWTLAFDPQDEVELDLVVSYSGAEAAPSDITVKIVVDPSIASTYNADNDSEYEVIPADWIEIANGGSAVIKQGEKRVTIPVKIKLGLFDLSTDYGLPIRIESATHGEISGNFGAGLYAVSPKSILDGTYTNTFQSSAGSGENEQTFSTVTPLVVTAPFIGIYSNVTTVTLDPENPTQVISVAVSGLGESSVAAGTLDPAKNYYDEATETLYLDYDLPPSAHWGVQKLVKKH